MKKNVFMISAAVLMLMFQGKAGAEQLLQFDFPNPGWHKTECTEEYKDAQCFMPGGQDKNEFREMLVFDSINTTVSAVDTLTYLLEKDIRKNGGNVPQMLSSDKNDAMAAFCSKFSNTCIIRRVFTADNSMVSVLYMNKMPHYSQNIFGQWPNILSNVKTFKGRIGLDMPQNVIILKTLDF